MREFLAFSLLLTIVLSLAGVYIFTIEKGNSRNDYSRCIIAKSEEAATPESIGPKSPILGDGIRP